MALVLRNTFIDFAEPEIKRCARRSNSAPPTRKPLELKTWEPLQMYCDVRDNTSALACDASTAESDNELSSLTSASWDNGDLRNTRTCWADAEDHSPSSINAGSDADGLESASSTSRPASTGKVTLCLDAAIADTIGEGQSGSDDAKQPLSHSRLTLCLDASITGTPGADVMCDSDDCITESGDSIDWDVQTACSSSKVTLCLDATVTSDGDAGSRTKLSSKARAFVPTAGGFCEEVELSSKAPAFVPSAGGFCEECAPTSEGLGGEILGLIEGVREVLQGSPDVLSVQVSEGAMGETTTVLAELRSSGLEAANMAQTLSLLKATLLSMAAESETSYVLGYGAEPFKDTSDGFKATIGCVTPLQEHCVCWDTYELGFCTHRNTCRWLHPLPADLMQFVLVLKESA
mmetsp:Transcript_71343/g.127231  ORF Transcript_71343/g.127231 Transcript_71343/m.127231 type:complete len:405 (+) Transcript_71343:85-1299(+)